MLARFTAVLGEVSKYGSFSYVYIAGSSLAAVLSERQRDTRIERSRRVVSLSAVRSDTLANSAKIKTWEAAIARVQVGDDGPQLWDRHKSCPANVLTFAYTSLSLDANLWSDQYRTVWRSTVNVKEAVQSAIRHVAAIFADEEISNVGLEEVEFDSVAEEWIVTVGFSRPWDYPKGGTLAAISSLSAPPRRVYKVLRVRDQDGEVMSVKVRAQDS